MGWLGQLRAARSSLLQHGSIRALVNTTVQQGFIPCPPSIHQTCPVSLASWRKSSQFFSMTGHHVAAVLNDTAVYRWQARGCTGVCCTCTWVELPPARLACFVAGRQAAPCQLRITSQHEQLDAAHLGNARPCAAALSATAGRAGATAAAYTVTACQASGCFWCLSMHSEGHSRPSREAAGRG